MDELNIPRNSLECLPNWSIRAGRFPARRVTSSGYIVQNERVCIKHFVNEAHWSLALAEAFLVNAVDQSSENRGAWLAIICQHHAI